MYSDAHDSVHEQIVRRMGALKESPLATPDVEVTGARTPRAALAARNATVPVVSLSDSPNPTRNATDAGGIPLPPRELRSMLTEAIQQAAYCLPDMRLAHSVAHSSVRRRVRRIKMRRGLGPISRQMLAYS